MSCIFGCCVYPLHLISRYLRSLACETYVDFALLNERVHARIPILISTHILTHTHAQDVVTNMSYLAAFTTCASGSQYLIQHLMGNSAMRITDKR